MSDLSPQASARTETQGGSAEPFSPVAKATSETRGERPPRRPRWRVEDAFVPLTIVVVFLGLTLATDRFLTAGNLINVMTQMAILAIIAFGVTIVMLGGAFDLSVGSQAAVHGCLAAIVMVTTGSVWLGVVAALLSGVLFGAINGFFVANLNINPFIVTLGTLVVGRGIALAITGARPVTGLPESIQVFGMGRPLGIPWLVWLMVACFLVATYIVHVHPFGLRVFAIGGNREAARLAGIRVARVRVTTFVLSGVFAAVAGLAITARLRSGQPTSGEFLELFAVAAVVLGGSSLYGGRGAVWRTAMGVALIAMIQNGLNLLNVRSAYQMVAIGCVFLIAACAESLRNRSFRMPGAALLRSRKESDRSSAGSRSEADP